MPGQSSTGPIASLPPSLWCPVPSSIPWYVSQGIWALPLALFLLKLIHVCQALPRDLVVEVICRDAGLLEELDVLELLGADEDGRLEVEVDDHDQLVVPAGLEEGMLDIRERNVYDVILLGDKADTVLMNL
jgi:hypothetical protein